MSRKRHLLLAIATMSAGFLGACRSSEKVSRPEKPLVDGVTVETIHLQPMPQSYEAVGTVRSATSSVVGAQIGGTVQEMRVKPGDRVRRGELLARLDDRGVRAQLAGAEAGIEESKEGLVEVNETLQSATAQRTFAEANYHRYQALLAKNSVSRQEFEEAETRYKSAAASEAALAAKKKQMEARGGQAQSRKESAKTQFSYSRIVSPIDGIVTAKLVDAGTFVMPGTPVFRVEDPTRYRLEASLPEQLGVNVHIGQMVEVVNDGRQFGGRVVEIVPEADPGSRTVIIKIELPGDCACRSGEYAKAYLVLGQENRLTIPRQALVERGELEGVFVVDASGATTYRLVKTGKTFDGRVEVLSGLADGERVATSQLDRLSDGVRVEAR
ncbi:MAG TPA: efflux RND transporter periplasmic adaptor subunit [Terriglobia bacterium]|nr:efflux RND transporter periplasmic adaptor subunit [Terriglobia bacterium]